MTTMCDKSFHFHDKYKISTNKKSEQKFRKYKK